MEPVSFGEPSEASLEQTQEQEDLGVLNGFLKDIPEQDRAIVEKYAKTWDGNVTKRFQGIHNDYKEKLKPYEELGADVDTLKRLIAFKQATDSNPVGVYLAMQQSIQQNFPDVWEQIQQGDVDMLEEEDQDFDDGGDDQDFGEMSPQVQEMIERLQNRIDELEGNWQESQASFEEEEQIKQFDNMLQELHTSHGDFDDDWVTLQIANGKSPEEAVEAYQKFVEGIVSSHKPRPAAPRIIGGQGGVPSDQVDVAKLRGSNRRQTVEDLLAQLNQG